MTSLEGLGFREKLPCTGHKSETNRLVLLPIYVLPHSLRLVLPSKMAPALRWREMMLASCDGLEPDSAYDLPENAPSAGSAP
jgi:hypothetical protein